MSLEAQFNNPKSIDSINERVRCFGRSLQQARIVSETTQSKIAQIISVSRGTLTKWETAEIFPDETRLPAIAEALGTDIGKK